MTPLTPACVCAKLDMTIERTKNKTLENLRPLIVPPFLGRFVAIFARSLAPTREISNSQSIGVRPLRCQILAQCLSVELPFPAGYDQCCYSISDHIYGCAEHAHETVDAENQGHAGNWDGRDDHQRSHQCDEGCALNSAGAFRG